jgi:hypothetical protein
MNTKYIAIIEEFDGGFTTKVVNTSQIALDDDVSALNDLDMCNYAIEQFANPDALTDCVIFNTLSEANVWISTRANAWINTKGVQA